MSFGHVASAISSLKNNRALRSSKKDGFKSNNRDVSKGSGKKTMHKFKEVSQEELEVIKLNIRKKGKIYRAKILIITLLLSSIVLYGIYRLIF